MTTPRRLELSAGDLRVSVDPAMGASILSFDVATPAGDLPVLAADNPAPSDAGQSALFPMAPFANRARGNRLTIAGREIEVPPNTDDPLCLHGWAWQRHWQVEEHAPDSCRLTLRLRDHGYDLSLSYEMQLSDTALLLSLSAVNESAAPAPVGLGFHPYFPRLPDTRISFAATTVWPEGAGHLPAGFEAIPGNLDYTRARSLPSAWCNQCYSGWTGLGRIRQPGLGYDLGLRATGTDVLMLYADPALRRFALEPQSHVSGETHSGPDGLSTLVQGQEKRIGLIMTVQIAPPGTHPGSIGKLED